MAAGLTSRQFAALARLHETGPCSQNALGRLTAMDNATISGVLTRLEERGLVARAALVADRRMTEVRLTEAGTDLIARLLPIATAITEETLAPLDPQERAVLADLLRRLG